MPFVQPSFQMGPSPLLDNETSVSLNRLNSMDDGFSRSETRGWKGEKLLGPFAVLSDKDWRREREVNALRWRAGGFCRTH